jgi:tetratricopeptide (TPR) repeat protein
VRLSILFLLLTGLLCAASLPSAATGESATAFYNRADYAGAVAVLQQAPANAANLELLGQSHFMLGDFRKATDFLEKAAALKPADSMIETWLGRAWGRRAERAFPVVAIGYATKTRDAFERAVRLDPQNAEALGDLFDFYIEAPGMIGGGLDKAEALLPQYARCDPLGYFVAHAKLDETKQEFGSAEANFRHAVEMAPRRISIVLILAQFLARRGRYEEAEIVFRQAASVAPDSPRIFFARADTYIKSRRNVEQARELLRKYLAANNLSPEDPPRWEAQKLLRKAEGG